MNHTIHLDLDGAWDAAHLTLNTIDVRSWGPQLRYCTNALKMNSFYREVASRLPPFILYGSGDFHHLSALWLRSNQKPFTLISFDNHPDWDRRLPLWQCGSWINRALQLPHLVEAQIWGSCSPDVAGFGRRMANPRELGTGRLQAHPYAKDWLDYFANQIKHLKTEAVYVTVDMDCLNHKNAITNWDQGRITAREIVEALIILRKKNAIIGGDLCGAWSEPIYARPIQRFLAKIDHDDLTLPNKEDLQKINHSCFETIWPVLTAEN